MPDLKYNKSTDSEHEIKLDSELISASWRAGEAVVGGKVKLEVVTAFVGNGAQIKIKGKSEKGESLGSLSGQVKNNVFVGELDIPEDIELDDQVYFEVKLSKNGIDGESNRIPVVPAVKVKDMKWSAKEARRGEVLTLSAEVENVWDGTEAKVTIYEYDNDGVHDKITELETAVKDKKISIDWEYEYHEDTDEVPTQEEMERYGKSYNPPEYFFVIEIKGQKFGTKQESKLLLFKDYLEIELVNQKGEPVPDEEYKVTLPDGTTKKGKLDKNGRAVVKDVPPGKCIVEFKDL
ncbi:MAG: hypothetical protein ACOYVF_04240 [Candidatus Zixiibacteriota bacterium]